MRINSLLPLKPVAILFLICGFFAHKGSRNNRNKFECGRTYVVRPKGNHQATIVWLHGFGEEGSSWAQLLENLSLPNIKWICPTAPTRPVALFGGFQCTAWCDVGDLSDDAPDDLEGLDAAAAHVANLLSTEPAHSVGGFSMGAATALHTAICRALGQYGNGSMYTLNLSVVIGLSGWLPCPRTLKNRLERSQEARRLAASLPILLCHGLVDDVIAYNHGENSAHALSSAGFRNLIFRSYNELGHYTIPEETNEVCNWLTRNLALKG